MRHLSLDIIHREHQALSAMLTSLGLMLKQAQQKQQPPSFEVLRAMLFYIDEFPERGHHTIPDDYQPLFQRILNHAPAPIGLGPA